MRVMSNAITDQVEVILEDRWDRGPLELVFLTEWPSFRAEDTLHVIDWNRHRRAGFIREADVAEFVFGKIPRLQEHGNPNVYLVPCVQGYTELHKMLASVVPTPMLRRYGLKKESSNMWLMLWGKEASRAPAGRAESEGLYNGAPRFS